MTDVVVPAHNEATTIGRIVRTIRAAPSVSRVIVVADACDDDTALEASVLADVVVTVRTADKGTAMAAGLRQVTTAEVLFVDADLEGLRPQHIEGLLQAPPAGGMAVGIRDELVARASAKLLPPITGERRLPTEFARGIGLAGEGYRAELLIDAAVGRAHLPHKAFLMVGVTNPSRATTEPVGWLSLWLELAPTFVANLGGLVAYSAGR